MECTCLLKRFGLKPPWQVHFQYTAQNNPFYRLWLLHKEKIIYKIPFLIYPAIFFTRSWRNVSNPWPNPPAVGGTPPPTAPLPLQALPPCTSPSTRHQDSPLPRAPNASAPTSHKCPLHHILSSVLCAKAHRPSLTPPNIRALSTELVSRGAWDWSSCQYCGSLTGRGVPRTPNGHSGHAFSSRVAGRGCNGALLLVLWLHGIIG